MKNSNFVTRILPSLLAVVVVLSMATVAYATDMTEDMNNAMVITADDGSGIMPMSTTIAQVAGNIKAENNAGYWSSSDKMITIPRDGNYRIYYSVTELNNTGWYDLYLHINSNSERIVSNGTANGKGGRVDRYLKKGDQIYFFCRISPMKTYGFAFMVDEL